MSGRIRVENEALRWRSRRGLLELELLLLAFVRTRLESLSVAEKHVYARLLEHDDCDIFDWIQARDDPEDPEIADLLVAMGLHFGMDVTRYLGPAGPATGRDLEQDLADLGDEGDLEDADDAEEADPEM